MTNTWIQRLRIPLMVGAVAALLATGPCAMAQIVYGQIIGTVTDPTGAAIPNASVVVTDVSKGTSVTLTSNGDGQFLVQHLVPDTYDVKVSATGFKGYSTKGLAIHADDSANITAVLPVGTSDQVVEVNADSIPQLKTDRADVSTTFTAAQIEDLPIPDHNFTNLQLLLPGAQQLGWAHAASENPQGSKQIQIDGQAFGGVNYTLDGTDNQDAILGIIVVNPNSESMSEAKIITQNYDAEFGKAVASVQTVQTKSGTNRFHGTLFDNRESAANLARDPFSQPKSGGVPQALKNQFGGSIGGPILKDKIFFFADYQGVRQKVGTANVQTVPTQLVINSCLSGSGCNFSEYLAPGAGTTQPGVTHQLYNPATGAPFAGNIIPNNLLSPTALKLITLLKNYAPNLPGSQFGLQNNYGGSGKGVFNSNQWDVRGDATLSQKVHIFGRFSRFTDTLTGATVFGNAGGAGFGLAGFGGTSQGANDSLALGTDVAVNSKLVFDVRLGYFRYNIGTSKYDNGNTNLPFAGQNITGGGLTVNTDFGAPDIDVADANISGGNGPGNGQNGGAQYGSGLNINHCNCPLKEKEDQFQIVNNWTKTIGNHAIKVGADLRYARNLRVPSDNDRTGHDQFGAGPTSNNGANGTGLGFASFVLGDVSAFNRYASVSTNAKEFQVRDFFYAQDTWRASPKLTINAGLRYEFYGPERVNGVGNGALLNLQTGFLNVAGSGPVPLNMGVGAAKNAYNPRLGVAYQLNQKTVIRAGYGRSFDLGVFGSTFGHVVTQNVPVLANQSINGQAGPTSYAFNLDTPAASGAKVTGLTPYTPVAPNSNGQISIQAAIPGAPAGTTIGNSVNVKARPFTERLPTLDAWNATVQRSITPTLSLEVAYVGNKGTHTLSDGDGNNTNPNEPGNFLPASFTQNGLALHYDNIPADRTAITAFCTTPGNCNSAGVPLSGTYAGATNNTTLLRRYANGNLPACTGACNWTQDISYYGDDQDTHYNALQISLTKTETHGLSGSANYAYQHALATGNGYATWNKQSVIGNDSAVRRSSATIYGLYKLPFGRNMMFGSHANSTVNAFIGGWEISPVFIIQSGLPFTLSYDSCGNYSVGPCYPNGPASGLKTGKSGTPGAGAGVKFFTPPGIGNSGFTLPSATPGAIGNTGRNTAWGPGFFNSDMSLIKNITFHEFYTVQLRMDAYNAFNHINYGNPGGSIDTGGQITSGPGPNGTTNPRQLQFTAHLAF